MQKVELLSPCGSYDSFLAAVNAGADAVYLAGEKYGARAYCSNFSDVQLTEVIHLAHLHKVKVYLTLNTLLKQTEIAEVSAWLAPFCAAGLDGVIIQDTGVLKIIRETFPKLAIHASTQMNITSHYGLDVLKQKGVSRVVPARELSVAEIREMKKHSELELETFIHGAMCYCYSGQCLMSSILGGRSGNRGRCAQPCRLPYCVEGKEQHYLSLKDMNTLENIPELIRAGIDSFKIEGRMKKPEYVAGVTSVYRKYIDLFYQDPDHYRVEQTDRELLSHLYIRTAVGNGYYQRSRGKEMITFDTPGYQNAEEKVLEKLQNQYIHELPKKELTMWVKCHAGSLLQVSCELDGRMFSAEGPIVPEAQQHPADKGGLSDHLGRMGNTPFSVKKCHVDLIGNCFVPVKWLNEIRRELIEKIIREYENTDKNSLNVNVEKQLKKITEIKNEHQIKTTLPKMLSVSVMAFSQLMAVAETASELDRIILDADLLVKMAGSEETIKSTSEILKDCSVEKIACMLPRIIREKDASYLERLVSAMKLFSVTEIVCPSLDALGFASAISSGMSLTADASFYHWNTEAIDSFCEYFERMTLPYELNSREIREICTSLSMENEEMDKQILEAVVYGHIPLMVSANCIKLSAGLCSLADEKGTDPEQNMDAIRIQPLTDRKNITFPVYTNCAHCYNIMYNSVPLSLHRVLWMLKEDGITHFRMDFTTENDAEVTALIQVFRDLLQVADSRRKSEDKSSEPEIRQLFRETTSGHFQRGVE